MFKSFITQFSWLGLVTVLLSACQPEPTDYFGLMTHPEVLERDMGRCQTNETVAADCNLVRRAANDFAKLVSDRAANPEGFGMLILAAETNLGILQATQKPSDEQQQKVAILLAVVAATSLVDN